MLMPSKWNLAGLVFILSSSLWSAHAATASNTVTYGSRSLSTRIWYPNDLAVIRGVVVFTGGQGDGGSGDTRDIVNDPFWQAFGKATGFAIAGNQFTGSYTNAGGGPGQALLDSLTAFSGSTGHTELAHAPLLLEGFSNGGYFSLTFTQFAPSRVIAFCVNKSGFANAPMTPQLLAVPAMLIRGSLEDQWTPTIIHALETLGRKDHALWAELVDRDCVQDDGTPGCRHEEGFAERAFAPFFAEMIALRYPVGATPIGGDVALIALSESQGWLGDHADASIEGPLAKIAPFSSYEGNKSSASWMANESMANLWRSFTTRDAMSLETPSSGDVLNASNPMNLRLSGVPAGHTASFFDGSRVLASNVAPSGETAESSWSPAWGGVRAIIGLAADSAQRIVRTSRPSNIVLLGKEPPGSPANDNVPPSAPRSLSIR